MDSIYHWGNIGMLLGHFVGYIIVYYSVLKYIIIYFGIYDNTLPAVMLPMNRAIF